MESICERILVYFRFLFSSFFLGGAVADAGDGESAFLATSGVDFSCATGVATGAGAFTTGSGALATVTGASATCAGADATGLGAATTGFGAATTGFGAATTGAGAA